MADYVPPIGIPAPAFGIDEVHTMYAGDYTYDYGSGLESYHTDTDGPYTHYIDNQHGSATDTDNEFGTPSVPRLTVPLTLTVGSVVEIHGGPYTYEVASRIPISGTGTAELPIFVRGVTGGPMPRFDRNLEIGYSSTSSYIIVENLDLQKAQIVRNGCSYISVRSNDCQDGGGVSVVSWDESSLDNIVVYDNDIYDNGDWESEVENDVHGVNVGELVTNLWVVDNRSYHNGGDGVQVNSGVSFSSDHIYIGRNVMYSNRENAVDLKQCNDAVVSENIIYGYRPVSSAPGEGIVVHSSPDRVWIINNTIYDCERGIVSSGNADLYIVGNVIYNIKHTSGGYDPDSAYSPGVGICARGGGVVWVVSNTLYDNDTHITSANSTPVHLMNNIFTDVAESHHIIYIYNAGAAASLMHSNLVDQSDGNISIVWEGTHTSIADFQSSTGKGAGCVEADPTFTNAGAGDLTLQTGSPAVDAGDSAMFLTLRALFLATYGLDIGYDIDGNVRPA